MYITKKNSFANKNRNQGRARHNKACRADGGDSAAFLRIFLVYVDTAQVESCSTHLRLTQAIGRCE